MEWKRAGSKGGIYPLLGNVDAVVVAVGVAVDGGVGDVEVGGDGCEDRLGLEGERRERDRDWRTVMGSLEDGSVAAGCGAMRAKEAGWIRRRGDGFYSIELAKQQTAVLIASVGIIKATSGVALVAVFSILLQRICYRSHHQTFCHG